MAGLKHLVIFLLTAVALALLASGQASAPKSVEDCKRYATFSSFDEQTCYNELARKTGDWKKCLAAPDVFNCVGNLALEMEDPTPILELTKQPESEDEVTIYTLEDRDELLIQYAALSYDPEALEHIKDNRKHDHTLIYMVPVIYGGTGYAPKATYCDRFRGDYVRIPEDHGDTDEEVVGENKNLCERTVSAFREIKYDNDACNKELPGRLHEIYGWTQETEVGLCKGMVSNWEKELEKARQQLLGDVEEGADRWALEDTQVNPGNKPTVFKGGGETPNYYMEARFKGKSKEYTVTEKSMILQDREVDHGYEYYNAKFVAEFDKPPRKLTPGDDITLTAKVTGSGKVSEKGGGCMSGIRFQYRAEGVTLKGNTSASICLDYTPNTITTKFQVPKTRGGELKIHAGLWNCEACDVSWVYKKEEIKVPELSPLESDDVDIKALTPYFDTPGKRPDTHRQVKTMNEASRQEAGGAVNTVKNLIKKVISFVRGLI